MFRVVDGNTQGLADAEQFIELINNARAQLSNYFDREADVFVARAPGRLDVMGGIADYSGSLVLEMPIAEATFAAIQLRSDEQINVAGSVAGSSRYLEFELSLSDVWSANTYDEARKIFLQDRRDHWASYVAGVFFVLQHELELDFKNGARILISSHVPVGKGVSSSAALEVATMQAVCSAYNIDLDARKVAMLCQKVENHIAGAPCGVMDQIASSCGGEHSLISILCQPAEIQGTIAIPKEIEFWGIDSGVRHSVSGADYGSVRAAAFMGYRILAQQAGLISVSTSDGRVKIEDKRWNGHLANISPDEYESEFPTVLPESIDGDKFLQRYHGTTDPISQIDRTVRYNVKASTEHAIYESARVKEFARLLAADLTDQNLEILGELMFKSHDSYSACGLTEPRTDRIVELVRQNRPQGLYGARITGGGNGGTVAILARRNSVKAIASLMGQIERESGQRPYLFSGSSPGAARFGSLRLRDS